MANASLTISFNTTSSADQFIDLELDDVLNKDETTFIFGTEVFFKMFTDCTTVDFFATENSVSNGTDGIDDVVEYISFTQPPVSHGGKVKDNTATTSKPITGAWSWKQVGTSGCGSITTVDGDLKTLKASAAGPGVYEITYESAYTGHKITGPSEPAEWVSETADGEDAPDYPLVIVAAGS